LGKTKAGAGGFYLLKKCHPCSEGITDNAALFVIKQLLLRRFRHDDYFLDDYLSPKNAVLSKLASNNGQLKEQLVIYEVISILHLFSLYV